VALDVLAAIREHSRRVGISADEGPDLAMRSMR
jgi:hypothetical protein